MATDKMLGISTLEIFVIDLINLSVDLSLDHSAGITITALGFTAYELRFIVDLDLALTLILKLHTFLIGRDPSP